MRGAFAIAYGNYLKERTLSGDVSPKLSRKEFADQVWQKLKEEKKDVFEEGEKVDY